MPREAASSYDEVPYPSAPYPYTHPDHLATTAALFGLGPQPADAARVLEVGCADGANLIPMAQTLPGSRFVGIDLSQRQIAAGREVISELDLHNIELHQADLMEFEAADESFDYIIAHGVLSWTPYAVQERLLELCRRCLAPHGVAFISYNAHPGWQRRTIIREWILRSTSSESRSLDRVDVARRMLRRLRSALQEIAHDEAQRLEREIATLLEWNDGYLLHDLLELHNQPMTFGEFLKRIEPHQLRFFAEADFAAMAGADLPPQLSKAVQRVAITATDREQLFDLLCGRGFRQSLLCRAERQPADQVAPEAIFSMYLVSTFRRAETAGPSSAVRFASRQGFAIDIERQEVIAALDQLARCWPQGAYFQELVEPSTLVKDRPHGRAAMDHTAWQIELATILLAGFAERAVELHTLPPPYSLVPGEFPHASPLARLQAARGHVVTNLRHDLVNLSATEAQLLVLLDGTRHRASLAASLPTLAQSSSAPAACKPATEAMVDQALNRLAKNALFIARSRPL